MRWMESVMSYVGDLMYALRGMRRNPGFAFAVVATLGLGIGANTAIFTVIDAAMLRPISYEDPDELFYLQAFYEEQGFGLMFFPPDGARAWVESSLFSELGIHGRAHAVRTDGEGPEDLNITLLTPGLLRVLRVGPEFGRGIGEEDIELSSPDVVVLGHSYWRTNMGADPDVLGSTLTLDDRPHTVIGVMPADFRFPYNTNDLYMPLREDGSALGRQIDQIQVVGRIPTGTDLGVITERFEAFAAGIQELGPSRGEWVPRLHALNESSLRAGVERAMWIVFGAVAVMLLIAIVNCVNLLLARGSVRSREVGVRLALGASRRRIMRQLMVESLVLALVSGCVAVAIASGGVRALMSVAPSDITWISNAPGTLEGRVLLFTFGLTALTGLVLGFIPAWRAVRATDSTSNGSLGSYGGVTIGSHRLRGSLVVLQVALSLTLLFGAGLLGRSFARLMGVDPGFDSENLTFLEVNLSDGRYPTAADVHSFGLALEKRLAGIPGIEALSVATGAPPETGITFGDRLEGEDQIGDFQSGNWIIAYTAVDEDYDRTLGIEILAGRGFNEADFVEGRNPVLIDEDIALHIWGTTSVAGRRFRLSDGDRWYDVVGVTADLKLMGLEDRFSDFAMLRPFVEDEALGFLTFNIRSTLPASQLYPSIREAVADLDDKLPIQSLIPSSQALSDSASRPRFFLLLMSVFAVAAVVLASVGIYGVLSFTVSQRRREMGIRLALGAGSRRVHRLVLVGGLKLALLGTALGIATSFWLALSLEGMLFETDPRDVGTMVVTAAAMLAVSAVACFLPARRATAVDPVEVLKAE